MQNDGETELFGRDHERSLLLDILGRCQQSSGSTLVLRGVAGIGKSALLRLAETQARQRDMSVLAITAVPSEAQLPYAGIDQLLKTLLASQPTESRNLWQTALGRAGEAGSPAQRYQLARTALNYLTTSAGQGRVLIIDDAQWLDRESWDILAFVGRRVADDKVCLLVGMRDGEESTSLLSGSGLPEHQLEPLSADASLTLLQTAAPGLGPALTQRVLRDAAGNPLGLFELGVAAGRIGDNDLLSQDIPLTERLERSYALTVSRLPALTYSLVLIAALDDAVDLGEVLAVAHRLHGPDVTWDDLEPAIVAGLLEADKEMVRFRHPLIRWTMTRSASARTRLATHAAIAAALDGQEARQVWHLAAATVDTDAEVADRLARIAEQADQTGSPSSALRAWERSAQLTPDGPLRARRLLQAAHAGLEFSQFAKVRSLLEGIEEDQLAAPERTELEWLRHSSDGWQWPYDQSFALLAGLAARLRAEDRTELALQSLTTMSALGWWVDLGKPVREQIVQTVEDMHLPESDPRYVSVVALISQFVKIGETSGC